MGIVLADYPDRPNESDHRPRPCRRQARVRGDDADEEDRRRRDRGGGARLGRVIGHEHPPHGAVPWFWVANLVVLPLGFYLGARLGGPRTWTTASPRSLGPWRTNALDHQFPLHPAPSSGRPSLAEGNHGKESDTQEGDESQASEGQNDTHSDEEHDHDSEGSPQRT